MAFTYSLNNILDKSSKIANSGYNTQILKYAAVAGLATGFAASTLYYIYSKTYGA